MLAFNFNTFRNLKLETMSMSYNSILLSVENLIARITLNKPERRNALSLEMMTEITECLRSMSSDVRAVIINGAGPIFSSGHDLNELKGKSSERYKAIFDICVEMMTVIEQIPQPVIAEVHGIATAAGCQLVAGCDLAIASDETRFAVPGVRIGLFCSTPMVALTRAVGRKRAMEMLLTGDYIDAKTAVDWGLINKSVPFSQLKESVQQLASKIAESSPRIVSIGKHAFYSQMGLDQHAAYDYAKGVMCLNALEDDAQEGIDAFLGKRKPKW